MVLAKGVKPEPRKTQTMLEWPKPSSLKSLRGFLGLTGFYRRFIRHYAQLAAPLTRLLCKDQFQWSDEAQTAFDAMKAAMTSAQVLALPDFNSPFLFNTYISLLQFSSSLPLSQYRLKNNILTIFSPVT